MTTTTTNDSFDVSPYIGLLRRTPFPIPQVRRAAIIETVRCAPDRETLLDIFFDATADSPYLTPNQKACLAEQLLSNQMESLAAAAGCRCCLDDATSRCTADRSFSRMARLIFHSSRKIRALPVERRRALGTALAQCPTAQAMRRFVLEEALPSAAVLDVPTRNRVALDIVDGRYYNLLLPDRLDCVEPQGRLQQPRDDDDDTCCYCCPICLGEPGGEDGSVFVAPCCRQVYCRSCIHDWMEAGDRSDCPTCRQELPRTLVPQPTQQPPLGESRRHRWSASV